jgi:CBS domain-containing protein
MAQRVEDVMTMGVETVAPDDTIQQAAMKMEELDVGPLPVVEDDLVIGILTDRDIAIRAVAQGCDPTVTTVRDTMTPDLVCCFNDEDVEDAVHRMQQHEVRRLPVLDRENHLVGMVALADLARHTGERESAEALKGVSQPTR